MEKVIGYCGIICSDCPVFMATQKNDDAERKRVAEIFTRQYGKKYVLEDINCDGCPNPSTSVFSYCNVCEIRKCGKKRNLVNCAHCSDYPCEKLSKLFAEYSKAKDTLDKIRRELGFT